MVAGSLDRSLPCPGSIGWRGERAGKGFTKSPQTWHYPPQHRITTHYIECDKDPGMNRTRTRVPSILLFRKYKQNIKPPPRKRMHLWWITSFDSVITAIEGGRG